MSSRLLLLIGRVLVTSAGLTPAVCATAGGDELRFGLALGRPATSTPC